jgi:hypothetical protein
MFFARTEMQEAHFHPHSCLDLPNPPVASMLKMSSCELLGIDAYAEDDLGYAPS